MEALISEYNAELYVEKIARNHYVLCKNARSDVLAW